MGRATSGRVAQSREPGGRATRFRAASGRIALSSASSGRITRQSAASGRFACRRAASGRDFAGGGSERDRSVTCLSLAHQYSGRNPPNAVWLHRPEWDPSWSKDDPREGDGPWNDEAYQDLLKKIKALAPGSQALKHISRLDCANRDDDLASCDPDPSLEPPLKAAEWREELETAGRLSETDYAAALARVLKALVCSSDDDAIYVMRGNGFESRLEAAGGAASGLIDDLMNKSGKDCPVSASLTDADRAKLLQAKRDAEKADK